MTIEVSKKSTLLSESAFMRPRPLRSTAARRLAQNAPLEHFDGLQPSLPKFGVTVYH